MVGQNLNFESFQGACSNFERGILVPLAVALFQSPTRGGWCAKYKLPYIIPMMHFVCKKKTNNVQHNLASVFSLVTKSLEICSYMQLFTILLISNKIMEKLGN